MKQLQDFILIVPNVISEDLRVKILQEYEGSDDWVNATIGEGSLDKSIRDVSEIWLSASNTLEKNNETRAAIDKELFTCAGLALTEYQAFCSKLNTEFHVGCDEGYVLLKYLSNQFYNPHTDDMRNRPRSVSCSFAINDDYEGGEWSFFDGDYMPRLNAGDAILFPSNFLFPHSIRPVLSGVRYSIVTWFR